MKKLALSLFTVVAASTALQLAAAPPKKPVVADVIIETTAERVLLPSATNGMLVFAECAGCPSRSLRTSATTVYRFNERDFSLAEFRDLLAKLPKTNVNVVVSNKTRELILLDATNETASIPAARPARNRTN
jgi:hypothetical protein